MHTRCDDRLIRVGGTPTVIHRKSLSSIEIGFLPLIYSLLSPGHCTEGIERIDEEFSARFPRAPESGQSYNLQNDG